MAIQFGYNAGMSRFLSRHALAAAIFGLTVLSASLSVHAQTSSCDPKYWQSMKDKAWVEAQREITQNQNLIYKPDSVLEYTCFDKHLSQLAMRAKSMFSESTTWGVVVGPDMKSALQQLVLNAMTPYLSANFAHTYLGGRSSHNYSPSAVTNDAAFNYSCAEMDTAWNAAKCLNFLDKTHDDFFILDWYKTDDPRKLAAACTPDARFEPKLNVALNNASASSKYLEEAFQMYTDQFSTTTCDADPIPTGITVSRIKFADYPEKVCINPGCAYDTVADDCVASPGTPTAR